MLLRSCIHEVLYEGLQTEDDVFEALDVLDVLDETIHGALTLGELHRTVLVPEVIIAHLRIRLMSFLLLTLEQLLIDLLEIVVLCTGSPDDDHLTEELGHRHLHEHIIRAEHPIAIIKLTILLNDLQVIHEVHIALLGNGKGTFAHMQRTVGYDVQITTEAEVLLVIGHELQMITLVTVNKRGILYIITVEADGVVGNRTGKRILKQAHLVIIQIHIGKHILQYGIEDITRLKQIIQSGGVLSHNDALLTFGILTVDIPRHRFVHTHRQNQLVIIWAQLQLVEHPLFLTEDTVFHVLRTQFIEGQRKLLVFVILVEVVVGQIGLLLGGNHPSHQFYGRIVPTRITVSSARNRHVLQLCPLRFQGYSHRRFRVRADFDSQRLIAHSTECQFPTIMTVYGKLSFRITAYHHVVSTIYRTGIRDVLAVVIIHDNTG